MFNKKGLVKIQDIPHATLAVAKFAGFVRQKDALLTSLAIGSIEIDALLGALWYLYLT